MFSNNNIIQRWISGYKIPFRKTPHQIRIPKEPQRPAEEISELSKLLLELQDKKVIKPCKPTKNQFISNIFLVPKPNGSKRLILNLKNLNKFIDAPHFKLEDLRTARDLMFQNCYMATLDLKDAYYLIHVKKSSQKFLSFRFNGKLYKFTCLPFGLNTAPYTFTKIMKVVVGHLRNRGFQSVVYLDDVFLLGNSYSQCLENIKETCKLIEGLGFIINKEKSCLIPKKTCKFLGFILNSQNMCITLPPEKQEKIVEKIKKVKSWSHCKIRDFASFIGILGACCHALRYGWVYLKDFEREKFRALKKSNDNFEKTMKLPHSIIYDLNWWEKNIKNASNPINNFHFIAEIYSDASLSGWGAHCGKESVNGFWTTIEQQYHINYLELLSAFLALKSLAKDKRDCNILLRIDNTTAISYINRMGGIQFERLSRLAKIIWQWCEERKIWIFASYVRSADNSRADKESRRLEPETEFGLSDVAFTKVRDTFGTPSIDLFASRSNTKCIRYFSWKTDPEAEAVDAFTRNWSSEFFYAFPPFSIILRTLQKIKSERSRGIMIVPNWKTQAWYPLFVSMLETRAITFEPNDNLLISLNSEPHPLRKKLSLVAGILSGKLSS